MDEKVTGLADDLQCINRATFSLSGLWKSSVKNELVYPVCE